MIDVAAQNAHLARSAQPFFAIALYVDIRATQRIEHRLASGDLQHQPGVLQLDLERVLVRRVCYAGGHESGRATLAIDTAPIPASRFAVPAGYKPVDLMGSPGRQGSD